MQRLMVAAVVPLAAALFVAGCGSSSSSSSTTTAKPKPTKTAASSAASSGGGSNLKLSADASGALKFNKKVLAGKSGTVTITMTNPSQVPHAIAVEGSGVDKKGSTVTGGGTSTVSASLKPGTYTFYCPVDAHKQAGMQGKLTVT